MILLTPNEPPKRPYLFEAAAKFNFDFRLEFKDQCREEGDDLLGREIGEGILENELGRNEFVLHCVDLRHDRDTGRGELYTTM